MRKKNVCECARAAVKRERETHAHPHTYTHTKTTFSHLIVRCVLMSGNENV